NGLAGWASRTCRLSLGWAATDGGPATGSPLSSFLEAAGFVRWGPGFRLAAGAFPFQATGPRGSEED
ncbi:MAG TPA: hypothetical protein VJU18_09880, partial [Vicinamibacteria bacterium]|nr:hypothetical protein [Vicinamibacteria bacterium]